MIKLKICLDLEDKKMIIQLNKLNELNGKFGIEANNSLYKIGAVPSHRRVMILSIQKINEKFLFSNCSTLKHGIEVS